MTIVYCTQWNYLPKASRAEEEIKRAYPEADILLVPGSGGVFDVSVKDNLIYSKQQLIGTTTERFPDEGELVALLQKAGF